jgi:hypothetical protein
MEMKIEGMVAGESLGTDLVEVYKMLDNLRYSQSLFTSCAECDRHQVLAILRRCIERASLSAAATIGVSIKDENGVTRHIALADNCNETMIELESVLRSVAAGHSGHAHGGSVGASPNPKHLPVN